MTPEAILIRLEALGVQVQLTQDGQHPLHLAPADRIPAELREEIVAHRADIAALIRADEVGWRAAAMRPQVPEFPRPLPLLLARPEARYMPGHCLSCGDPVPATRCEPCRLAVVRVLGEWQARRGVAAGRQSGSVEGS